MLTAAAFSAAADWAALLGGLGTIDIEINVVPTTRASAAAAMYLAVEKDGARTITEPGTLFEILTGTDPNGGSPDIIVSVDPTYLQTLLWFDPDPAHPSTTPGTMVDGLSVLRHEIGHGLGINGYRDPNTGALSGIESTWDRLVQLNGNGTASFIGSNALAVAGVVAVTTMHNDEQYSHLGNTGDADSTDLMNGVAFAKGRPYPVSALDAAIIKDVEEVTLYTGDPSQVTYLGQVNGTFVYRIDLQSFGFAGVRAIQLEDDNIVSGGTGAASGAEIDFLKVSSTSTTSASTAYGSISSAVSWGSGNVRLEQGFLQPWQQGDPAEWNRATLLGTSGVNQVNFGTATLTAGDGVENPFSGTVSIGEGGRLTFSLSTAASRYLYIGEEGARDDFFVHLYGSSFVPLAQGVHLTGSSGNDRLTLGVGSNVPLGAGEDSLDGAQGDDVIFGAGGSDVVSGGDGNDALWGDAPVPYDVSNGHNRTLATAQPLINFNTGFDPNIQNSTIQAHTTVVGTGDGNYQFYSLNVTRVGVTATFDIDLNGWAVGSVSLDSYLRVYNASGIVIAENDDSLTTLGGAGSTSGADSYLQYTFTAVGTYYIEVAAYSHNVVPAGAVYQLNTSVSDLTAVSRTLVSVSSGANDILNGGPGSDTLDGGPGVDVAVFSGPRSAYTLTHSGNSLVVSGPDGVDTLTHIEQLTFSDRTIPSGLKLASSDFSSDAFSDILWRNDNGAASIWDNGAIGGAHIIAPAGIVPNSWHIADSGDFDGDGRSDILWRNDNGAVSIWDTGAIGNARIIAGAGVVPNGWHISGTGDFDGNGHSDILWRNDNGAASIWDNGQIGNAHIIANAGVVPNSWHIAGTGDFDADGLSDILWRNDNGAVSIWDTGAIGNARIVAGAGVVSNGWHISGTGDFDGNGHDDILWRNDNGAVSIWDNGRIENAHIIANAGVVPNSWHIADTGDYDGNGYGDILWQNDNGAVSIWDNGQIANAHIIANAGAVPGGWHIA
jgi:hypothetical protein